MLFDRHKINGFFQLLTVDDIAYQQLVGEPDYDAIINCLTRNKGAWKRYNKNKLVNFQAKHLTKIYKIWHHFVTFNIA